MDSLNEELIRIKEMMGLQEKDDACTRKVKSRYKVWPSAYASGALVKCRKVGASNWGTKSEGEHEEHDIEEADKTDYSKEKSQGLHGWFSRKGGSGSKGWVDCNTCRTNSSGRKTCKACGRKEGEKRKYPACRPTPASCGTPKKGEKWGKKSNESLNEQVNTIRLIMGLNEQSNPLQYGVPYEDIKKIIKGYIDCALWTEEERLKDEYVGDYEDMFNGEGDDENQIERLSRLSANLNSKNFDSFTHEDMEDNSVIKVYEDVKRFVQMAVDAVRIAVDEHGAEQVGHDLWLSRNGHGAGFFDRGYDDDVEEMLMSSAKKLGGVDLYINDNIKLSFSNE